MLHFQRVGDTFTYLPWLMPLVWPYKAINSMKQQDLLLIIIYWELSVFLAGVFLKVFAKKTKKFMSLRLSLVKKRSDGFIPLVILWNESLQSTNWYFLRRRLTEKYISVKLMVSTSIVDHTMLKLNPTRSANIFMMKTFLWVV